MAEDLKVLETENESLREDAETYQNRIEDLKEQVERLTAERDTALTLATSAGRDAGKQSTDNEGLEKKVRELEGLVFSMRINGAKHYFVYGHQKYNGTTYIDHCSICEQDKGHPAHFAQGGRYLDSREVEMAAKAAQERLINTLVDGGLGHRTALNTAREILRNLPGIDPFQEVPNRPEVRDAPK